MNPRIPRSSVVGALSNDLISTRIPLLPSAFVPRCTSQFSNDVPSSSISLAIVNETTRQQLLPRYWEFCDMYGTILYLWAIEDWSLYRAIAPHISILYNINPLLRSKSEELVGRAVSRLEFYFQQRVLYKPEIKVHPDEVPMLEPFCKMLAKVEMIPERTLWARLIDHHTGFSIATIAEGVLSGPEPSFCSDSLSILGSTEIGDSDDEKEEGRRSHNPVDTFQQRNATAEHTAGSNTEEGLYGLMLTDVPQRQRHHSNTSTQEEFLIREAERIRAAPLRTAGLLPINSNDSLVPRDRRIALRDVLNPAHGRTPSRLPGPARPTGQTAVINPLPMPRSRSHPRSQNIAQYPSWAPSLARITSVEDYSWSPTPESHHPEVFGEIAHPHTSTPAYSLADPVPQTRRRSILPPVSEQSAGQSITRSRHTSTDDARQTSNISPRTSLPPIFTPTRRPNVEYTIAHAFPTFIALAGQSIITDVQALALHEQIAYPGDPMPVLPSTWTSSWEPITNNDFRAIDTLYDRLYPDEAYGDTESTAEEDSTQHYVTPISPISGGTTEQFNDEYNIQIRTPDYNSLPRGFTHFSGTSHLNGAGAFERLTNEHHQRNSSSNLRLSIPEIDELSDATSFVPSPTDSDHSHSPYETWNRGASSASTAYAGNSRRMPVREEQEELHRLPPLSERVQWQGSNPYEREREVLEGMMRFFQERRAGGGIGRETG